MDNLVCFDRSQWLLLSFLSDLVSSVCSFSGLSDDFLTDSTDCATLIAFLGAQPARESKRAVASKYKFQFSCLSPHFLSPHGRRTSVSQIYCYNSIYGLLMYLMDHFTLILSGLYRFLLRRRLQLHPCCILVLNYGSPPLI